MTSPTLACTAIAGGKLGQTTGTARRLPQRAATVSSSRIGKLTKPDYSKIAARFLRWRRKRRSPLKHNTKRFGCVTN